MCVHARSWAGERARFRIRRFGCVLVCMHASIQCVTMSRYLSRPRTRQLPGLGRPKTMTNAAHLHRKCTESQDNDQSTRGGRQYRRRPQKNKQRFTILSRLTDCISISDSIYIGNAYATRILKEWGFSRRKKGQIAHTGDIRGWRA